jgi:hypothetical protein
VIGDVDPTSGCPFANDSIVCSKPIVIASVDDLAVRQEPGKDIAAKHECAGSEAPEKRTIFNPPSGREILVSIIGVE